MVEWFSAFWCRKMHTRTMWPIHGKYVCPQCFREYPVNWTEASSSPPAVTAKTAGSAASVA